jgi:membrane-bound ClpP family serine protease
MAENSNQPVKKRSARLQAVIDLVKEEIKQGKTSSQIDQEIKPYNLTKDEEAELIVETFEIQLASEKRKVEKQKLMTAVIIGLFMFFFGLYLLFISLSSRGVLFYMAVIILLGGGYYAFKNYLIWRNE